MCIYIKYIHILVKYMYMSLRLICVSWKMRRQGMWKSSILKRKSPELNIVAVSVKLRNTILNWFSWGADRSTLKKKDGKRQRMLKKHFHEDITWILLKMFYRKYLFMCINFYIKILSKIRNNIFSEIIFFLLNCIWIYDKLLFLIHGLF